MTAESLWEHLVRRLHSEADERHLARTHRPPFGMHAPDRMIYRAPSAIVRNDRQCRQAERRRSQMTRAGYAENIAAVANHRDHCLVRRAQLDAERRTHAPSQMTCGGVAKLSSRPLEGDVAQAQIVLVDENRAVVAHPVQTV